MTSDPQPPAEPGDAPERRIRRGCLPIIMLALMVAVFNFLQYGFNVVVLVASVIFLAAVVVFVLISREGRG